MELSKDVLQGLTYLGSSSYVAEHNFKRIAVSAFGLLAEEDNIERVASICPEKATIIKQSYAALLTLVVECVRQGADEEVIKQTFVHVHFKPERAEFVCDLFEKYNKVICKKLQSIATTLPNIIDANWRLDFVIRCGVVTAEPVYYIVLTTETEGTISYLRFTCDLHQLQSLCTKLREVVAHIKKFAAS